MDCAIRSSAWPFPTFTAALLHFKRARHMKVTVWCISTLLMFATDMATAEFGMKGGPEPVNIHSYPFRGHHFNSGHVTLRSGLGGGQQSREAQKVLGIHMNEAATRAVNVGYQQERNRHDER